MKELQLISAAKSFDNPMNSPVKEALNAPSAGAALGRSASQNISQYRDKTQEEIENAVQQRKLKKKIIKKETASLPSEEPLIAIDADVLERKKTIAMFAPSKPVVLKLDSLRRNKSYSSTPNSLLTQSPATSLSKAKEKKGTMLVTELWSYKHSQNVKVKSGIMWQAKEIEGIERQDLDNVQSATLKPKKNLSFDVSSNSKRIIEGRKPSEDSQRLLHHSFVNKARHHHPVRAESLPLETDNNIENEESIRTLKKVGSEGSNKSEKRLKEITKSSRDIKLPALQITKSSPTWKSNFHQVSSNSHNKNGVGLTQPDVSQLKHPKDFYGALDKLINECSELVTPESDVVTNFMHFDIRKLNLNIEGLNAQDQKYRRNAQRRRHLIQLGEDAEEEDIDRALEFESFALALATRKKYRS